MAKLPNIIEKDRSLWTVTVFVLKEAFKGSRRYTILRYLTTAIGTVFSFVGFGAFAIIVNEFATHGIAGARVSILVWSFILLAVSNVFPSIISSFNEYAFSVQNDDIQRHLQAMEFIQMNALDIGTIEQPEFQNIFQTATNRGWNSFYSVMTLIDTSTRNVVSVIVATVSMAIISPTALAVIFVTCLPTYFLERRSAELSAKLWKDNSEKNRMWGAKTNPLNSKDPLVELKNLSLVKVFLKKFLTIIGGFHSEFKKVYRKQLINDTLVQIALVIGFGGAFALLIRGVYVGAIAIGALVFSFTAVTRFQTSLNSLFDSFGRASEHRRNLNIFMDFVEMAPMITSGSRTISRNDAISIEFKDVSFSYPATEVPVIKNLSLTINPGDSIAIVGLNGAGKTTLVKLLTRVYDPTSGEIFINGVPLREYDLKSWKECLGILLQEYSIYSEETVEENIMLGDTSKHEHDLVTKSATETTIDEVIMKLPNQYQQRVGTEFRGGVEFSKGQKQKLALARVLYRDAPFVILDEPTASIDAVSEDTIFKSLRNHSNQTRIIISHKFSNVREADKIVLIEHGAIIEEGTHDQLMTISKGRYRELFELQAEGYK